MPPPIEPAFNPYSAQVNQYAQVHSEPASRVQSMSSAASFQSPVTASPWKSHVKDERSLSFNAFGPYSTGPDMGFDFDPAFALGHNDGLTSALAQSQGTLTDATAGTSFGVAENSVNGPSYELPPCHGADLAFDVS